MYTAYFDESGTHDGSDAIVVAGYIANDQQWQEFDREWNQVLASAGVAHFHMKDFAHSRKEFESWKGDEERRGEFLKRLISVIRGCTRHSFATAVILKDYEELNKKYRLKELCSPYVICALTCVADVAKWCNARGYPDPTQNVFEDGVKYKGEFLRFYPSSRNFHQISYAKKHDFVAFQAADFVAWEHTKKYRRLLSEGLMQHRNSFSALYSMPCTWGVYEATCIERFCKNFSIPLR